MSSSSAGLVFLAVFYPLLLQENLKNCVASRGLLVHVCLADNSLPDSFFYHSDGFFEVGDTVLAQPFDENPGFWVLPDLKNLAFLFNIYQVSDVFQVNLHER